MQHERATCTAMKIISSGRCDKGKVRHDNQDALLMMPEQGIFAVVDGMGGMNGGEYAARFSAEGLNRAGPHLPFSSDSLEKLLADLSHELWKQGLASRALFGMGAALAMMYIRDDEVLIGHTGDCRVYLLRDGCLRQLTRDRTLIQDLIDRGIVAEEARRTHPWRGTLSTFMGQKDLSPVVQLFTLQAGDFYLICSDGLTKELEDHEILSIMRRTDSPEESCTLLLNRALELGGRDNITIIILYCNEQGAGGAYIT